MIITIKSADFSAKNIGTLSTWTILTNLGSGATYSGNRIVEKIVAYQQQSLLLMGMS